MSSHIFRQRHTLMLFGTLVLLLIIGGVVIARPWEQPTSPYPRFGHAADFSWIAGEMQTLVPDYRSGPDAGCAIVRYGENGARVQAVGYDWTSYFSGLPVSARSHIVIFGRLAHPDEPFQKCLIDNVPGYFVDRVQGSSSRALSLVFDQDHRR